MAWLRKICPRIKISSFLRNRNVMQAQVQKKISFLSRNHENLYIELVAQNKLKQSYFQCTRIGWITRKTKLRTNKEEIAIFLDCVCQLQMFSTALQKGLCWKLGASGVFGKKSLQSVWFCRLPVSIFFGPPLIWILSSGSKPSTQYEQLLQDG